ncbi:MAG: hypothetical protein PHX45_05915 [Acidobacteriota bacterium]|nr:hypothetical protein [Acidobacteriota bacterium]
MEKETAINTLPLDSGGIIENIAVMSIFCTNACLYPWRDLFAKRFEKVILVK